MTIEPTVSSSRGAIDGARTGLRLYQESLQHAISVRQHQEYRPPMSAQDKERLDKTLFAITELILALRTGCKLEDPWTRDRLPYAPQLEGMAMVPNMTYAKRILEVEAEAQAMIVLLTGKPIQRDIQRRSVAKRQCLLTSADVGIVVTAAGRSGVSSWRGGGRTADGKLSILNGGWLEEQTWVRFVLPT